MRDKASRKDAAAQRKEEISSMACSFFEGPDAREKWHDNRQ